MLDAKITEPDGRARSLQDDVSPLVLGELWPSVKLTRLDLLVPVFAADFTVDNLFAIEPMLNSPFLDDDATAIEFTLWL